MKNKKQRNSLLLVILLLAVTIGYAVLTTNLKITGTANIKSNTWDVHFENIQNQTGVTPTVAPTTNNTTTTELEFTVDLDLPGDFYQFNVDAVNDGSIDAMVSLVTTEFYTLTEENEELVETKLNSKPAYINYSVTYDDDTEILENHLLAKNGGTETYKVRIEYDEDQVAPSDVTLKCKITVPYIQATDDAVDRNVTEADFETDSWEDIVKAYNAGKTEKLEEAMENGTTRTIQLDMDNDGIYETPIKVRIANLSTPNECKSDNFSQTACGFVLEFADIIAIRRLSTGYGSTAATQVNGYGTKGGWEYSELRAYLNGGTYTVGNVSYSNNNIYKALPNDLKNEIKPTKVISGYSSSVDSEVFETVDNLYIFSATEIWWRGDDMNCLDGCHITSSDVETEKDRTRQLDYYRITGVNQQSHTYESPMKKYNETITRWWLRTPKGTSVFYTVKTNGRSSAISASISDTGVSPAFRIA